MIYTVKQMQRDVRVAIDMNHSSSQLLSDEDTDTLQLDDIIRDKLVDAVRLVELEAPSYLLEKGHDFVDDEDTEDDDTDDRTIEWSADVTGAGTILLPSDFMRLVMFKMSDWRRAVYSAYSESDPEYAMLSSKYRGICGNPEKPAVAIVNRSEGLALEFYSCGSEDAYVTHAVYIPLPCIDDSGGIDISEKCYRSAVYRAAYLTLLALGDQNAAAMLETSKSLLA